MSCDLPDGAQGVQLVYDSTADGFPPGTSFQPNLTAAFTGPAGADDPIENCAASSASSTTVAPTAPAEGCDTVDPFPVDGTGDLDFVEKTFLGDDPVSVLARSDDQATAQITWSTNGFSGVDPMVVSDIADPATTAVEDSFYDAFDLVSIGAVDSTVDPLISYDAMVGVELYDGTGWTQATGSTCTQSAPCEGGMPAVTLTDDERESTTSVRLVYTEEAGRTTTGDPLAPQPGDGVARSTLSDGRHLDLTFQVRDDRRSDGTPVLGSTDGTLYNTTDPGLVQDTVRGTATFAGEEYTDTASDDVLIIDQPLNVSVAKDWTGGPISVPPTGTPAELYPSTTVSIVGTNESAAKVDQLRLVEPGVETSGAVQVAAGTKPFDAFTVRAIDITPPEGTTATLVTVSTSDGGASSVSEAVAESLQPEALADVVGVEVSFDGLVEPGASGTLDLVLQLRETDRYTGAPVTVADYSPVPDGAVATIDDPGGTDADVRLAYDDADMTLQDAGIGLEVGKTFDPGAIVEPGTGPTTMTITGQPVGPSRSVEMVLTDDDPQFWNQYDLVGFAGPVLAAPIQQVQVDAFVGGTFEGTPGSADPVTVTGGDWVPGVPATTFALPDGVAPEDVHGLRFTFSRTDGGVWENPATPAQSVPVSVERREDMRSGGPVLPDLEANPSAPGETAPGVASNTVTGTTTGADLVVDPESGETVPVSATDDAQAQIVYQHAQNGAQVVKDFNGVVSGASSSPDAVNEMRIAVTNTGDRPIVDPVIVDSPMPADAEGPQLRLADGVADPYAYTLTGAAPGPANGPPMPTDPDEVIVEATGDLESLTFTFPEGTVLEVGQTYTITVQVQFRVGLPPQTLVTNTAGVTGDRPWDECVSRLDETTGVCEADADITPVGAAVLAQSKLVKATDDDQLDVLVDPAAPGPPSSCTPDAAGFYAYPCTPVIAPGHDETWRIRVDNVGNLPMDTVVVYDRLPAPGDTGSYAGSPRDSQWEPIVTNDPPPSLAVGPAGAEATFYYTTSDDYCMDDIDDPVNEPVCPTDDPTTGWVELTGDVGDDTYSQIAAVKAVVTFPEDDLFAPGEFIALDGTTTTPPLAPAAGDRSIAWNSAAASGVVLAQGVRLDLLPTEGVKVGVAAATGPLEVNKIVTGDGARYAPDSFELAVQCTSAVGTWVETVLEPIPVTVVPGTPTLVENLPYGAECTLTEDGSNGETELVVGTVTIDSEDPQAPTTITAVNRYDLAGIVLEKDVVSDAVDQDGQPVPFGPFEATVTCTFLGETVYAEGYDADAPMVVEIDDQETVELTGLPVGSECTVTETGTGNASSVTITVVEGLLGEPTTTDGTAAELDLAPDLLGAITNTVTLTNTYDVGAIDLTKIVDGSGADVYGDGPFTIHVTCLYDDDGDGPREARTVYDDEILLGGQNPLAAQITDLPAEAVCAVEEVDDDGATGAVVVPDTVTVASGQTAGVVVTNTFDVGSVQVDKDLAGLGALYGPGPFDVALACTYGGVALTIPGGAAREIDGGSTVVYDDLPVGALCTLTETDDFGASSTTITTADGTTVDGTSVDVTVPPADAGEPTTVALTLTNTFDTAPLVVTKQVDGDGAGLAPAMPDLPDLPTTLEELADLDLSTIPYDEIPYEVTLTCTFEGQPVPIPGGDTRRFGPGLPGLYLGLPDGAVCTASETETGGATSVTVAPETVTVDGTAAFDDPVEVVVTNTYTAAEAPTAEAPTAEVPGSGGLPMTGARLAAIATLALALTALGALVVAARRRRRGPTRA